METFQWGALAILCIILSVIGIESIADQDWMQWLFGILAVGASVMWFWNSLMDSDKSMGPKTSMSGH